MFCFLLFIISFSHTSNQLNFLSFIFSLLNLFFFPFSFYIFYIFIYLLLLSFHQKTTSMGMFGCQPPFATTKVRNPKCGQQSKFAYFCMPLNLTSFLTRQNWIGSKVCSFLIGISAMCRVSCLSRNDVVFNKCQPKICLQVLFRGTHWLRHWAQLQHSEEQKERLIQACRLMEMLALHFFASYGWPFNLWIGFQ